jgi:hypothetical protein
MTTLIITVGTRQVGWLCDDGIVRSLGLDGERGIPHKHIDELYRELKIERGSYPETDSKGVPYSWSVRHLAEQLYDKCCENINDFSRVQLLMDEQIISQEINKGLNHIILWGTNQPETVSWNHRRLDTFYLAKLMEGKIKQTYRRSIDIDVWEPIIVCVDVDAIREEVERCLLNYISVLNTNLGIRNPELLIATKGSTPAIASTLEICAAALSRQYPISQVKPNEPNPAFDDRGGARISESYQKQSIGKFFWPLEKEKIISAWKRGDFNEAKVWLEAHRDKYQALYELAGQLSLSSNGELRKVVRDLQSQWIESDAVRELANSEKIQSWNDLLNLLNHQQVDYQFQEIWEKILIIELMFYRQNYTNSFILYSQLLENILSLRYQLENWNVNNDRDITFYDLIEYWGNNIEQNKGKKNEIHQIRLKRNEVIHQGLSIDLQVICELWRMPYIQREVDIYTDKMIRTLEMVAGTDRPRPQILLLRSLYEWGLDILCES